MQECMKSAQLSEYIRFMGKVDNPAELMNVSSIFLLPSLYEGYGIVLAEAQLCGTRCIASVNVPVETQLGGVDYLPIANGTKVWVDKIKSILADDLSWNIDENKAKDLHSEMFTVKIYNLYVSE